MQEIWEALPEYVGIYEISNYGNVRTCKGKTTCSEFHGQRVWNQRTLKQKTDKKGYKRVTLYKDKQAKTWLVHRLVAQVFIPRLPNRDYVNHKDGNPSNNILENLEWVNSRENLMHAYRHRLNCEPDPIILFNTENQKTIYFRSKAEASRYLGKNHGYISGLLKNGKSTFDNFEIYQKPF
ncbi:NUMOD4 domain-containing protein [Lactococcus lactis]|uniref:NUMOD4 domain-containing protein n=1 Tax=Lactococcus lactis TaxID=1358 RepID=UPI0028922279|nr:NUMOD4 domain-containing protein [Lactococcus lactis]MDT2905607.1 NUMOD4 domain-containing protein [Lactococcus lactis]MDT2944328.1 NUMOD4 domain-containing protein [Lactococcus lactis]